MFAEIEWSLAFGVRDEKAHFIYSRVLHDSMLRVPIVLMCVDAWLQAHFLAG